MVARQFRVLEAASSSPATSTNTKGSLYGSLLYWSNGLGERLLQTASDFLFSNLLVRFDELAIGEFGVHPSYARWSRHFDQTLLIQTFEMPNEL